MTFNDVREIGLKLPGAEETRYYRMPALKVNEEVFVVKTSHPSAESNSVSVAVGFKRRDELVAARPETFYLKPHYEPYPVVLVRLDRIKRAELKQLLHSAHDAVSSGAVVAGRRREPSGKKER
ncbi:MAG TPA: MmcQ/YjbR family DNA-binding protein [Chthoniobacterales bacterium]